MKHLALRPIVEPREVGAFLQRVPLAVDRGHFIDFVLGFPHKYLAGTPAAEVLKHYVLMEALRDKAVISSLSRVTSRVEQDPARFFFGDQIETGIEAR